MTSIVNKILTNLVSSAEKSLLGTSGNLVSSGGKSTSDDIIAGDIEIVSLLLMSEDQQRKYDLLTQCKEINIYEDITSPVIYAELGIQDSIGLYQSFPILGEEYVSISFRTPGTDRTADYLFRVNMIHDKTVEESNKMVTYYIQCISPEILRNATTYVNKSYKKNIHEVVNEIIKEDLVTEKPVRVDVTAGIEEGLITRMQPFKAIDFLRQRAVSNKYKSSVFTFFESRDGYRFTTLEQLIEEGKKTVDDSDKHFFFDTIRKENIKDVNIRNIIAYNQLNMGGNIAVAQSGGLKNEVSAYDFITGSVRKIEYKDDGSSGYQQLDKNGAKTGSTTFSKIHGTTTADRMLVPISSDSSATMIPDKISNSRAFALGIINNTCRIHIYGDSEIKVGDVIKCTLPSAVDAEQVSSSARLETGNYLVAKVRHIITNTDRPQHTIALELIKGDFPYVA